MDYLRTHNIDQTEHQNRYMSIQIDSEQYIDKFNLCEQDNTIAIIFFGLAEVIQIREEEKQMKMENQKVEAE